jgi:hypothetical protein
MGQHSSSRLQPPAGARIRVIRGGDACAVARAVRLAVGDGIVLPAGPYRYPYAAVVHLLRLAGLFQDPAGDTATDPVLTREALTDSLRLLLPRGVHIGVVGADCLDRASASMLGAFAETARLAARHGLRPSGLVLGAVGELPPQLQSEQAELLTVAGLPDPLPRLSPEALLLLALLKGAPHPVQESALLQAGGLPGPALRGALRELASAELAEPSFRVALGPAAARLELEPRAQAWLDTPEVWLPHARLAAGHDPALALHLGNQALQHDDPVVAAHCFALAGSGAVHDRVAHGLALARGGSPDAARALFDELRGAEPASAEVLQLGILAALLSEQGRLPQPEADALLRKAERAGAPAGARAWRARLLAQGGANAAARNLLRRTRRAELEQQPPEIRLEHALAEAACLRGLGDPRGAANRLAQAAALCATRADMRRVAKAASDPRELSLAAEDLDAAVLAAADPAEARLALEALFAATAPVAHPADELGALFERLRAHGATLLAALVGEVLELHPPGAHAQPGLAARLEARLRMLRAFPQAVTVDRDELANLGSFSGHSALVLHSHGSAGPLIAVFKGGNLPPLQSLLGEEKP